ncbi:hypothetical protein AQBE111736_13710 [Aquirufa beregesia]
MAPTLGLTVIDKRSPPVEAEMAVALAVMNVDSALYKAILPVATPAVKVMVVAVPKFTAAAVLSVTVGTVTGLVEELAPAKVTS